MTAGRPTQVSPEVMQIADMLDQAKTCLLTDATSGSALWRLVDACGMLAEMHHGHAPGTPGQPTGRGFFIDKEGKKA